MADDVEKSQVVRARFLPRPVKREVKHLAHHHQPQIKHEVDHSIMVEYALHRLSFIFDAVR